MKIGNLKHGQTLKNIKELCEVLKIPYKDSTDSRKAIFKDLDRYCKYHKEGRKIVIDEIFQKEQPKVDNRKNNKGGNNVIYANDIEFIILDMINRTLNSIKEKGVIGYSKSCLYEQLGLVNKNYKPTKDKVLQLSDILSIPSQSINECYNVTNSKLWNTVKSALNHMRNRALLNWELSYNLVLKDEDSKNGFSLIVADTDIKEDVRSCELKALKEMNISTKSKVLKLKKWEEFKNIVTYHLKDIYPNLEYYFESVAIYFKIEEITKELELIEQLNSKEIKYKLNENISDGLDRTYTNRQNNSKVSIKEKTKVTTYDNFKVSKEYVPQMKTIKNTIVDLKADAIDFNFDYDGKKTMSQKQFWETQYQLSAQQQITNSTNETKEQLSIFTVGYYNCEIEEPTELIVDEGHIDFYKYYL